MDSWVPITAEELEAIIAKQLGDCPPELQSLFSVCRTPLNTVPILRFGKYEEVFVVAKQGDVVIYYEDVEEGFNLSTLAPDGSISSPGFEQLKLCHALSRLAG